MLFAFTEEQDMLRAAVRGSLQRHGAGAADPAATWALAREQGWAGLLLPEAGGGLGLRLLDAVVLQEELGRALAGLPLATHAALPLGLRRCGLALPPGLAASLADGGVVLAGAERRDGDTLIEFPDLATHVAVVGLSDGGTLAVVPVAKLGPLRSVSPFDPGVPLALAAAHLPAGDAPRLDAVLGGVRLLHCAEIVGSAEAALDATLTFVRERRQFDRPVGSFQAVKHRLADAFVAIENAKTLLYHAAWSWDADPERAVPDVDGARARIARTGIDVLHAAIQLHGGAGFTWAQGLHLRLRRVRRLSATLGTVTDARRRIAAAMLERQG